MLRNITAFTFIEVLTAVVIVSILSVIGFSTYSDIQMETRRSDAHTSLLAIQYKIESYINFHNTTPAAAVSALGIASQDSKAGYYSTQTTVSGRNYTITATPKANTSQANDTACLSISLNQSGTRTPTACW